MEELTISEIASKMASGELTSRSLTEQYLARIVEIDKSGPSLNAVIELNPDALETAAALDAERVEKGPRGPLHGIPVLIKDNIDTADKMTTTAGSLALLGSVAPFDSTVAGKLREAGAILLGKTNLSEWANFRSTHSVSGWSSRGGQSRNPYALNRNPCGSSSGSGAAVAANLCAVAVGTETDGSIICPSSINGIVGIKPTVGLISRAGIIPISHSQDTAGPMARTVADAAILLSALAGTDARDSATVGNHGMAAIDYAMLLDRKGLRGAKIGVARNFSFNPRVDAVFETCIAAIKDAGAVIVDNANIETEKQLEEPEFEVLLYEFKAGLNAYLASLGPDAQMHTLSEIIEFNERHRNSVMPWFGQEILIMAQERGDLTDEKYCKALADCRRLARSAGLDATLSKHGLDALIAPSGGPAWLIDYVNGDHYGGGSSSPAAIAGYPSITVPAGYIFGLPVGISFIGPAWSEEKLIRLAYSFEQATKVRKPPEFLPSVRMEA